MVYSVKSKYLKTISNKNIFWHIPTDKKEIFLTFDDGPVAGVTEAILDLLKSYNAKATFFCVGDNVRRSPQVFSRILEEGHSVGNHTFHHVNGWKYSLNSYVENVKMCDQLFETKLFRPPYGKFTPLQRLRIQKDHYVILWSVLPGDFDPKLSKQKCLFRILSNASTPGSIIVLHDSVKASKKVLYVLPRLLEYFTRQGYQFSALSEELCKKTLENKQSGLLRHLSFGLIGRNHVLSEEAGTI